MLSTQMPSQDSRDESYYILCPLLPICPSRELRDTTLFLGSSFLAHQHAQHEGARGAVPERQRVLFKGETKRKRIGIPMFRGKVE
jgi:hypothetical protein